MTGEKAYRLGEYRIIVYDDVLVRWERHVPLGMVRIGNCFRYGDVLVLGEKFREEDGFLIGEFIDELSKLPPWTATRFSCFAGELLDTETGRGLTDEALARYSSSSGNTGAAAETSAIDPPGTYRLGTYSLTVTADGRIAWQAYGNLNRIVAGSCSVLSGILVIGPQEHDEPAQGRQAFLDAVKRLQPWNRTTAWTHGSVLRLCADAQQDDTDIINRLRDRWRDRAGKRVVSPRTEMRHDPMPVSQQKIEPARTGRSRKTGKFLMQVANAVNNACQRVRTTKVRSKWCLAFITAMLMLGSAVAVYFAEKDFPWQHDSHKHHRKHHND